MMIDSSRRKRLALHLRQLSTGQISNDEFEERVMNDVAYGWTPEQYFRAKESLSDDAAIRPILEYSWCLYNDTFNHKLKGEYQLNPEQIKEIARLILFLHSDQEYEWKYVDITHPVIRLSFTDFLKNILTFGKHYREIKLIREQEFALMKEEGDFDYWPFKTRVDFEAQLDSQPFLIGKK